MLLELEDLETDFAAGVPNIELPIVADTDKVRVLPVRKLNPNLPRKRILREPSCACCPLCAPWAKIATRCSTWSSRPGR